jgi:hypothetical protein
MTKKVTTRELGAPVVSISNTMLIDKREVMELMIIEKEEMLEEEMKGIENRIDSTHQVYETEVRELKTQAIGERCKQLKKDMLKSYKLLSSIEHVLTEKQYTYNTQISLVSKQHVSGDSYCQILVELSFPKEVIAKVEKLQTNWKAKLSLLQEERSKIKREISLLPKKARRLKSIALRKALEQSKEGKEILSYFRKLREEANNSGK